MAAPLKTASALQKSKKQVKLPKPTQNDLRRLMREKQSAAVKDKDKIDSPLAKYNSIGQLCCVLCNCQVKNEILWTAHVNGRQHKESLQDLKDQKQQTANKQQQQQQHEFKKPEAPVSTVDPAVAPPKSILKRKVPEETAPRFNDPSNNSNKRLKDATADDSLPKDFFDTPSNASSSTSNPIEKVEADHSENKSDSLPSEKQKDFFDVDDEDDDEDNVNESKETAEDVQPKNSAEALPEGFFDDPMVDAKVRKVEYKDPVEEEWEKFQREIAQATNKAQVIIDEDEDESTTERQIVEIDEQINNWARVEALQRRKDELVSKQKDLQTESKDIEKDKVAINEHEFEEFLDWRSKSSWR